MVHYSLDLLISLMIQQNAFVEGIVFDCDFAMEIAGEGNRKLRKEKEQDSHSVCEVWPSQLSPSEESLLRLCFPRRSQEMGARMLKGLQEVAARHAETVGEVRGRGLMIGLEFREDEIGELVVAALLRRGVCVAYALNNPRVLRFEPPLIITAEQVDFAVEAVDGAIAETVEMLADLL